MNEPTTSLRDSLEEVVDQVEVSTPEAAAPSTFEPDLSDIEAPEPATEEGSARTRDEQGRFAPKAPAAPQEAVPQETPAIQPGPKSGPRTEPHGDYAELERRADAGVLRSVLRCDLFFPRSRSPE